MERKNKILSEIKKAVLSVDSSAEVILFGSMARGDYKDDSDWDILILTNNKADRNYSRSLMKKLLLIELDKNIGISTIVRNKKDWQKIYSITPFYNEIQKDGVVL